MIIDRPTVPTTADHRSEDPGNALHLLFDCLDPTDIAQRLKTAPSVLAGSQKRPTYRKAPFVFWDTQDLRLGRAGLALSVETKARERLQHIADIRKVPTGGTYARAIVTPLGPDGLDLTRLAFLSGIDPALIHRLEGRAMVPIFAIHRHQTLWSLFWGETRLRLHLTHNLIESTAGTKTITELDLLLIDGPAFGLYDFAQHLVKEVPVALAARDAVQDTYQSLGLTHWWDEKKLTVPHLTPTMTLRQGILEIGRALTSRLRTGIDALQDDLDPDRIHQTRIAFRQLRSAFSVFRTVLPPTQRRLLGEDLAHFAGRLGLTREWDVFLSDTVVPLSVAVGEEPCLRSLRLSAAVLREGSATEARAAFNRGAFLALSLKLGAWFDAGLWPETPDPETDACLNGNFPAYARDLLRHRHRKLLHMGQHLVDPTPGDLHILRIEAKKLRYAAEFLHPLFSSKQAKPFLTRLRAVQAILGTINDAASARSLVPRLTQADPNGGERAAGIVTGWTFAAETAARRRFKAKWSDFADTKKFW